MAPGTAWSRPPPAGFTLLELVIVVAILGLLATLALPAYGRQVLRAHRSDATVALMRIATAQEGFYLDNHRYAASIGELGIVDPPGARYALAIPVSGTDGFTATATARGSQAADSDCQVLAVTSTGERFATGAGGDTSALCWRR